MLVGGILMVVSTFLNWRGDISGLSLDSMGLFGIITLILGALIAVSAAVDAFGLSISLPDAMLGHSRGQLLMMDAFAVFIWTFAHITADGASGGLHMAWIGALVALVGSAMNNMAGASGAAS